MKIIGVCACTAGIAHTYMAKQKLIDVGESRGHLVHIETQGAMGAQDELTKQQIHEADIVIIAADVKVGKERFGNKTLVEISTSVAIKSTNQLYEQLENQILGENK
ncbi:MAG: PTS fructose transporter subunit IIB [Brevinema sp.]